MFDIFYNNTNGDIFEKTTLSQEGLEENFTENAKCCTLMCVNTSKMDSMYTKP